MTQAVAKAGEATVMVDARKRLPASGILIEKDLILTASHVVERETGLKILFGDGNRAEADLVGRDRAIDLAVLRLSQPASAAAEPAPDEARVGQIVLALGRPSENGIEASLGVVSAVGGPAHMHHGGLLERYLRTDTIPYPGFSGGPLVDASGRILGLNTSGLTHHAALTIPAAIAWQHAQTLAQHGRLKRGFLGVRSQPVELPENANQVLGREQATGLLLVGVDRDSPAAGGGMMVGDILVGIAGTPVSDPDELMGSLTAELVGQPAEIEVLRGGQRTVLTVTVGERK
jgi:S1-C subfamily serine protease